VDLDEVPGGEVATAVDGMFVERSWLPTTLRS
jgi:hypothetical protein